MSMSLQVRPPKYHHFVLLVWEERGADGQRSAWRFSLQDSQNEARIGFKDLNELTAFLERWMKDSSPLNIDSSNKQIK
ncbi:MAG: hypothetical protein HKUEN02_04340 [Anaerolineaceae bacterium]|nr:MAG: hypothetical protein HKUEN02_04340 [Anaerolineaceae bacterium]